MGKNFKQAAIAATAIALLGSNHPSAGTPNSTAVLDPVHTGPTVQIGWRWIVGEKIKDGCVVFGAQQDITPATAHAPSQEQDSVQQSKSYAESSVQNSPGMEHLLPKIFKCKR